MTKESTTDDLKVDPDNPTEKRPFFYRSTFDPLIARLYKNTKCSQCYGKGYFVSEIPPEGLKYFLKGIANREVYTYCRCVDNNIKKERIKKEKNKPIIQEG